MNAFLNDLKRRFRRNELIGDFCWIIKNTYAKMKIGKLQPGDIVTLSYGETCTIEFVEPFELKYGTVDRIVGFGKQELEYWYDDEGAEHSSWYRPSYEFSYDKVVRKGN